MNDEKKVKKIWEENEKLAEELAYCYYESLLNEYKKHRKNDSKENFGFNTFVDGIRLGFDITMPMQDEQIRKAIKNKIHAMTQQKVQDDLIQTIEKNFKEFEAAFQKKQKNIKNRKQKVSS